VRKDAASVVHGIQPRKTINIFHKSPLLVAEHALMIPHKENRYGITL
jgi:hypothetical protein